MLRRLLHSTAPTQGDHMTLHRFAELPAQVDSAEPAMSIDGMYGVHAVAFHPKRYLLAVTADKDKFGRDSVVRVYNLLPSP